MFLHLLYSFETILFCAEDKQIHVQTQTENFPSINDPEIFKCAVRN